ncbi:MAG: putative Pyridoxal phosphate-dependent deaminase family protein [Burkholderiaceae bacterium]|nr:putative Pyridoxal phosphate-dependent deaminase family protein [Burkholderiaceae bacterium]
MTALQELPRQPLGFLPTPLVELKRLSRFLGGPRIWIKRDDQTGLAFGGNKTRKLEFLLGDALAQGADTLVTGGAAQSNHCRQTAAAAAASGLECHLALGGTAPDEINGNLLLDQLLGAHVHWCGEKRKGEDIPLICERLQAAGRKPYIVPYGGSSAVGALGYAWASQELFAQLAEMGERMSHMVFASSSGGTHAGLLAGRRLCAQECQVVGIRIDQPAADEPDFVETILSLANAVAARLELGATFTPDDVRLRSEYTGAGYGVVGEAEREAVSMLARHEGILLDPVYTGRAMAGLIDLIRQKEFSPRDSVLFWHTGGGPALFAYAEALLRGVR